MIQYLVVRVWFGLSLMHFGVLVIIEIELKSYILYCLWMYLEGSLVASRV